LYPILVTVAWVMWCRINFTQHDTIASLKNHYLLRGLASQKGSINFYHMGVYVNPKLLKWFVGKYHKRSEQKLDMGKRRVRFKKMEDILYKLIGELMKKVSVKEWIEMYEKNLLPKSNKN
jgi:hypothetical protein